MRGADVSPRSSLPRPLTSLVGCEREIAAVSRLVLEDGARLVTLTGTGGIGKTRLALAVAGQLGDAYADGVWFVSLAAIGDPDLVIPTISRVLDIDEQTGRPGLERLVAYLREWRALLVLDNFEHLIIAATDIAQLLPACPELTVLATSREPLRLSGEREFPVPPLSIHQPGSGGEAVRLFADRAQRADPAFGLTEANAQNLLPGLLLTSRSPHPLPPARPSGCTVGRALPVAWLSNLVPSAYQDRLCCTLAPGAGRLGREPGMRGTGSSWSWIRSCINH